jgi:hypothetical protein
MISLAGLVILAAAIAGLWFMLPRNGVVVRAATMPFVESLIPIGIISGIACGIALIFAGMVAN